MSVRPLNDRVLIKPIKNADETESGIILPENRADTYAEMQGEIVAVGHCAHPRKQEAEALADRIESLDDYDSNRFCEICGGKNDDSHSSRPHSFEPTVFFPKAAELIRSLVACEPCVKVGDHVLFSWSAGQQITIDDEEYLLMREDDLLAVVEG